MANNDQKNNHLKEVGPSQTKSSKPVGVTERFWQEHKDHPDPEKAWHNYYQALPDLEKYQMWQEYHMGQEDNIPPPEETAHNTIAETKKEILRRTYHSSKKKAHKHLQPIIAFFVAGFAVLALQYNMLVIAQIKQYISPGSTLASSIIVDPNADVNISDDPMLIIPKINLEVPIVYSVKGYDEGEIQKALEGGVVHYGETPTPGQPGNNVIVGHSSNNFFNSGKYKFAFVLLDKLQENDTFIINHKGKRYIYRVYNKKTVAPNDFSGVQPTEIPTTTLITCTPPGTSWKRLYVQAEQISPEPNRERPAESNINTENAEIVPSNSPSFFRRTWNWIF